MADVRCPMCSKSNPEKLDNCQFCGARLHPLLASTPGQPLRPGETPVKNTTSEFEKVTLGTGKKEPIRPGEEPTKKDTGKLEKALPTWLRNLRGEGKSTSGEQPTESSADQGLPPEPGPATPPDASAEIPPDRLAGLQPGSGDEEEIRDYLASIRGKVQAGPVPPQEEKTPSVPQSEDWLGRLGESKPEEKTTPQEPVLSKEELPAWLAGLQPESTAPATPNEEVTNFLAGLHPSASEEPAPTANIPSGALPDWLARLKEESAKHESKPSAPSAAPAELSDWLSNIPATPGEPEPVAPKPFQAGGPPTPVEETPDWLSKLQAEAAPPEEPAEQEFKVATEPMKDETPAEPVPDWLAGVKPTEAKPGGTPALIFEGENAASRGESKGMFSMETPDWLSKLKPEEGGERAALQAAEEEIPETLEPAELPSWVQALRPMEAVVEAVKPPEINEDQTPEEVGPLAGLRGVLPSCPGLGPLRKPPAYSIILQVNEGQQRHAALLERIVTTESDPRLVKAPARLASGRVLRWAITLVLLLAAGLPLFTGAQFVPTNAPYPPEMIAAINLIGGLPPSSPILLVFDYEPALSGELEAAAAPVIDHLLFTSARLSIVSTSPTGPALAERFLLNTQTSHNYQEGQQYVNLGYLAGGPAGVLAFAQNPLAAAPFSVDGSQAWQMPPLQGVQKMSDFAAVIVLTDNPDTGRTWVEQTGAYLGSTPMLMVISAQAEPMIRPYYDSDQIKGLVTGLAGGKAYEQAIQRPGLGGSYWNAFSSGMLVAELMIVVGAVWSAVSAWRARHLAFEGKA